MPKMEITNLKYEIDQNTLFFIEKIKKVSEINKWTEEQKCLQICLAKGGWEMVLHYFRRHWHQKQFLILMWSICNKIWRKSNKIKLVCYVCFWSSAGEKQ